MSVAERRGGGGRGSPYARGGGRGAGGPPRGGGGRGTGSAQRQLFHNWSQRGGGSGSSPARGGGRGNHLRGAAPNPSSNDNLLNIVSGTEQDSDAFGMVSLGAYEDDEFDDTQYEPIEHGRAAELGEQFRDTAFLYGQDFGNQEIQHLIPEFPDPDNVVLDLPTNCPPSRGSFLKSAGKTLLFYLPTLPMGTAATPVL